MGGAGAIWRHAHGLAARASAWRCWPRPCSRRAVAFGAPRLIHLDQLGNDPGALLFGAEMLLGLALPALLLRRGERIHGYLAMAALAIVAVLAIGPVTALVRDLADRF